MLVMKGFSQQDAVRLGALSANPTTGEPIDVVLNDAYHDRSASYQGLRPALTASHTQSVRLGQQEQEEREQELLQHLSANPTTGEPINVVLTDAYHDQPLAALSGSQKFCSFSEPFLVLTAVTAARPLFCLSEVPLRRFMKRACVWGAAC